jgi:hypothetical protein
MGTVGQPKMFQPRKDQLEKALSPMYKSYVMSYKYADFEWENSASF